MLVAPDLPAGGVADGVLVVADGEVVLANEALRRMVGGDLRRPPRSRLAAPPSRARRRRRLPGRRGPLRARARIIAIADAFDALTCGRPYQPAVEADVALERLERDFPGAEELLRSALSWWSRV